MLANIVKRKKKKKEIIIIDFLFLYIHYNAVVDKAKA